MTDRTSRAMTADERNLIAAIADPLHIEMLRRAATAVESRDANLTINGLMNVTVLAAIVSGVSADTFAKGIKHTWDNYARQINSQTLLNAQPAGSA